MHTVEEILKQLLEGQKQLFAAQQQLFSEMSGLNSEVAAMKSDMATKTQQNENTAIIKAIMHNVETITAKVDGLTVNTASKEAVALLDAKFDVLNNRFFQQEADLQLLKKAQ